MYYATTQAPVLTRAADGLVAGVCEGIARRFGVSSLLVRLLWLGAVLLFGTGVLLYLVMWWIVPREDRVPVETTAWEQLPDGRRRPYFRRTTVDRKLLGVCGGFARRFGVDASLVRLGVLTAATMSAGLVLIAYLVAALLMPSAESGAARAVEL